jgi:hypothetical protein
MESVLGEKKHPVPGSYRGRRGYSSRGKKIPKGFEKSGAHKRVQQGKTAVYRGVKIYPK